MNAIKEDVISLVHKEEIEEAEDKVIDLIII